jgi:hypothetical protein
MNSGRGNWRKPSVRARRKWGALSPTAVGAEKLQMAAAMEIRSPPAMQSVPGTLMETVLGRVAQYVQLSSRRRKKSSVLGTDD